MGRAVDRAGIERIVAVEEFAPPETPDVRAQVLATLDAAAALKAGPGHPQAREVLKRHADDFAATLERARRPGWMWFEIVLGRDAARLPQALIRAGKALGRPDHVACGVETLEWMLRELAGRTDRLAQDVAADARLAMREAGRVSAPALAAARVAA